MSTEQEHETGTLSPKALAMAHISHALEDTATQLRLTGDASKRRVDEILRLSDDFMRRAIDEPLIEPEARP